VYKRQQVLLEYKAHCHPFFKMKQDWNSVTLSSILFNLALQNVIQSIKMVPNGMKIGKEQFNVLAYADGIVLTRKNETEIRQLFVEIENIARKLGQQINQGKTKYTIVE